MTPLEILRIMDSADTFRVTDRKGVVYEGERLDTVMPEWDEDGVGYVAILTHADERWGEGI